MPEPTWGEPRRSAGTSSRRPYRPPNFTPAGIVEWAEPVERPPFISSPRGTTARRAAGIAYERKCQVQFEDRFSENYIAGQWFAFKRRGDSVTRYCQPDGILFLPLLGRITIVEFKLQHTENSWWQVRLLYHPVLMHVFPPELWEYSFCEVVKWYDPDVRFPERVFMAPDITVVEPGQFGVHIYKP